MQKSQAASFFFHLKSPTSWQSDLRKFPTAALSVSASAMSFWNGGKKNSPKQFHDVMSSSDALVSSRAHGRSKEKRQISLRDVSHGSLFVESVFKNSLSGFRTGVCGSGGAGRPISSSGPQERALRIDGRRV